MLNWKVWKSCKELKKGHRKSKIEMEMELWKGRWSFWLGLHFRLWETVCGGHLHKVCFQSFALWLNMLYLFAGTTNLLAFRLRTLNTIPVTILSRLERPRTIKLTSFSLVVLIERTHYMRWYGTKAHYYTILRDVHIEESALNEDVGYLTNFRDLKQNVKSRRFCHVTSNLSYRSSID